MNELKKNGSGYVDYTAYEAIKQASRGGEKVHSGEIWGITQNNGTKKYVIVLAVSDDCTTILRLTDAEWDGAYPVKCKGLMYTDVYKIGYCFYNTYDNFIRAMTEKEYADLMEKVAAALGLPARGQVEVEKPVEVVKEIVKPDPETGKALAQAETERDIYKALYQELMAKCMGKAGWC